MPPAPPVVRATTALLACAGGLAACGVAGSTAAPVVPGAPSTTVVVRARFTKPVDLDHGGLLVAPPPARPRTTVTESEADAMFEAADAVQGPHDFAIFGLGVVTVATRVENPAPTTTTTTAPPSSALTPTTTSPPTTAPQATTTAPTTTAPPSAPTTAVPPTTAPSVVTPPVPALPTYRRRLAWVGIAWGATATCSGTTTTRPATTSTTYVAIVIDARTGQRTIAYTSGGTSPCTGSTETPTVTEPNELLSVPWQPVGPASTAVQIAVPPCGHYYGWTQVPTAGGGVADQVVVSVPFDPSCGATVAASQSVDQVVPLGAGQVLVDHAVVGPVQALQALPSS